VTDRATWVSERRRISEDERDEVYAASLAAGVPAMPGEDTKVGYHYYWHLLTRTAPSGIAAS
jgi:hypothetical protein